MPLTLSPPKHLISIREAAQMLALASVAYADSFKKGPFVQPSWRGAWSPHYLDHAMLAEYWALAVCMGQWRVHSG